MDLGSGKDLKNSCVLVSAGGEDVNLLWVGRVFLLLRIGVEGLEYREE